MSSEGAQDVDERLREQEQQDAAAAAAEGGAAAGADPAANVAPGFVSERNLNNRHISIWHNARQTDANTETVLEITNPLINKTIKCKEVTNFTLATSSQF